MMCLWFHTLSQVCAVYHYIRHLTQYSQCNKRLILREIVAKARTRKKRRKNKKGSVIKVN